MQIMRPIPCCSAWRAILFWVTLCLFAGIPSVQVWPDSPEKVVSLSPSITELLYHLELDTRLIGVTKFCKYPLEARQKTSVGGFLDPNLEAILSLSPDLVLVVKEHQQVSEKLRQLDLRVLELYHSSTQGILASFTTVGAVFGIEERAALLRKTIEARMDKVARQHRGLPKLTMMFVMGRQMGTGKPKGVYVAGINTFYNEIIQMVGGDNVIEGNTAYLTSLSSEGVLRLNPDLIIDLMPGLNASDCARALQDWNNFSELKAVQDKAVHILSQDYAVIPGPRFITLLEEVSFLVSSRRDPK